MSTIPESEAEFPLKARDPNGRIFWWKGDLYRALPGARAQFYEDLFRRGVIDKLVSQGFLIETERTSFQMEGYPLILKHRSLPFITYPQEWPAMMLKDAALQVADMMAALGENGLTLQDPGPLNLLFDWTHPVWVDFGSIVSAGPQKTGAAAAHFRQWFLPPLRLQSAGHGRLARWLLQSSEYPALQQEVADLARRPAAPSLRSRCRSAGRLVMNAGWRMTPPSLRPLAAKPVGLVRALASRTAPSPDVSPLAAARQLRREAESITIPLPQTEWADYLKEFPPLTPSPDWSLKRRTVHRVLSDLRPTSVLEIGSNRGWYSQLAASLGSQVLAFDVDETALTQLYLDARATSQKIIPLVMNFKFFTPAVGYFCRTRPAANDRLRCDMAMAIALTHHLVFKQHLRFESITEGLDLFTKKWLLVEFKPRTNKHVSRWWTEEYSWYTLENLVAALGRRFNSTTVLYSEAESALLLCQK